jgi:lysozyme family protein
VNFDKAFSETMRREGGYVLHNVPGDTGGQTYAGIARNKNPQWAGWAHIDRGAVPPTAMVRDFYHEHFWLPMSCHKMRADIAASVFDFGVNAGTRVAVRLAQLVAGVEPDGVAGPVTIEALNKLTMNAFHLGYFAAKMKRYAEIVSRNPSQAKFIAGWTNRSLDALT